MTSSHYRGCFTSLSYLKPSRYVCMYIRTCQVPVHLILSVILAAAAAASGAEGRELAPGKEEKTDLNGQRQRKCCKSPAIAYFNYSRTTLEESEG